MLLIVVLSSLYPSYNCKNNSNRFFKEGLQSANSFAFQALESDSSSQNSTKHSISPHNSFVISDEESNEQNNEVSTNKEKEETEESKTNQEDQDDDNFLQLLADTIKETDGNDEIVVIKKNRAQKRMKDSHFINAFNEDEQPDFISLSTSNKKCLLDISKVAMRYQTNVTTLETFSNETDYKAYCMKQDKEFYKEELEKTIQYSTIDELDTLIKQLNLAKANTMISRSEMKKNMYLIKSKTKRVIQSLKQRLQNTSCFSSIVAKYTQMTQVLTTPLDTTLEKFRLIVSKKYKNDKTVLTTKSEVVKREYRKWLLTQHNQLQNTYNKVCYDSEKQLLCDGDTKIGSNHFTINNKFDSEGILVRKFNDGKESYNIRYNLDMDETIVDDVTGIIVLYDTNRFFSIKQWLYRWRGPIVFVVQVASHSQYTALQFLNNHYFPKRVTFILYITNGQASGSFYINKLRNIGITNIKTSHFIVLDADLILSLNTYSELRSIPKQVWDSDSSAVILPVFFFNKTQLLQHCDSISSCSYLAMHYNPANKIELIDCLASQNCFVQSPSLNSHSYVMPEWFLTSMSSHLSRIRCFAINRMEPYVMMKRSKQLPLYNPSFSNYGYNKIEYFEEIREAGFLFFILNQAFAMDIPHPKSRFQAGYVLYYKKMQSLFEKYQDELNQKYQNVSSFHICVSTHSSYYEEYI